ncbi:MAG: hypothetical protein IKP68_06130 [Clostridia bacterium]|nr:hypothetical protein [Clostridia bacterium]
MTIIEAINRTDAVKPNQYTQEEKIRWLSILDGMVKKEIIDVHEGADLVPFTPYAADTALDTVLLIAEPYAQEAYTAWLSAQIDYSNEEINRYANSMAAFNAAYSAYSAWYNRTYMPLQRNRITTFCSGVKEPVLPWPLQG